MKRSRFTEEQIAFALKQQELGKSGLADARAILHAQIVDQFRG